MPFARVVQLRVRETADVVSVGSGLLVTDRLVLTARHVVPPTPGGRLEQ